MSVSELCHFIVKFGLIPEPKQRTQKAIEHEGYDDDTNDSWSTWNNPNEPGKETRRAGDPKKHWDYPDHSINDII